MSDAIIGLIGVFIGGLIGSVSTIVTLRVQYLQWKKQLKYEHLTQKREQHLKIYEELGNKLRDGIYKVIKDDAYFDKYLSIDYSLKLPPDTYKFIKRNIDELLKSKKDGRLIEEEDESELLSCYLNGMQKELKILDQEIEEIFK